MNQVAPAGEGQSDVQHPRTRQADRVRDHAHATRGRDVEQNAADEEELAHERLAQLDDDGLPDQESKHEEGCYDAKEEQRRKSARKKFFRR